MEDSTTPTCPFCGAAMRKRKASRGRNKGNYFWGCKRFPACRGTRDFAEQIRTKSQSAAPPPRIPKEPGTTEALAVSWGVPMPEIDYVCEYATVGAAPGFLVHRISATGSNLARALGQCAIFRTRERIGTSEKHAQLVSALLIKFLRRGRISMPTLGIEEEALHQNALLDQARNLANDGIECGWDLGAVSFSSEEVMAAATQREEFCLDPAFEYSNRTEQTPLQSRIESRFLKDWVRDNLGAAAGHWFTPQASLGTLSGLRSGASDSRRIDFLFSHPGGPPLAIEIDGEEHGASREVDREREQALLSSGITTIRVSNEEINRGTGPALELLLRHCKSVMQQARASYDSALASTVMDISSAAKVQFAVAKAVGLGWLGGNRAWKIRLSGAGSVAARGILDLVQMISSLDLLYGGHAAPSACSVLGDDDFSVHWVVAENGDWRVADVNGPDSSDVQLLRINVELGAGPFHTLPNKTADFIIRSAFLPLDVITENALRTKRLKITLDSSPAAAQALRVFLRQIFRKREFRPKQVDAILANLRQQDSIVLLPTGAGKSLIYQLTGMLMPGVTLVVDPIVALMEDQVEGLKSHAIDRATYISRDLSRSTENARLELNRKLRNIELGEYLFVFIAPERLQIREFRNSLESLATSNLVNLGVIDEAHCVSEWGHDFRPAYLKLGNNLRRHCAGTAGAPPLLALTGTASRVVLRDMIADLEIDDTRTDALIRPDSFDRPEISYEIVAVKKGDDPEAKLRGTLNSLPTEFQVPRAELYQPQGRHTMSGIVFVPTVRGRTHGLAVREAVAETTGAQVKRYSGSAPAGVRDQKWAIDKRANARQFKNNEIAVLVATKAFGMGIDKPNIRYVVHFGMPSSLEAFYQEVGRAGRDGKPARSKVVFTEYDPQRTSNLLDPGMEIDQLRADFKYASNDRTTDDDITRALWFHLQGFGSIEEEKEQIADLLGQIGDLSMAQQVGIPFTGQQKSQETSIFRLMRIGMIDNYEVDYGGRQFVLHTRAFDLEESKKSVLTYVRATQRAKSQVIARRLEDVQEDAPYDCAIKIAEIYIQFTYDVIERSRRRMILETVLLARQARSDNEIRQRLLDYLTEKIGAESLDQLLDADDLDLREWMRLAENVQSPLEAGELRGLCVRALESYPDHPGLLMIRGVAEAMCPDHDETVSSKGLSNAVSTAILKYELPEGPVSDAIDLLFGFALEKAHGLAIPMAWGLLFLASEPELQFALNAAAKHAKHPATRHVLATWKLQCLIGSLEAAASLTMGRFESPYVKAKLGGK